MLRGSKVKVIRLFKESPEKLIWHSEILPTSAAIRPCLICMGMKAAFLLWSDV
jgi:hypothetical protein